MLLISLISIDAIFAADYRIKFKKILIFTVEFMQNCHGCTLV